jgi:putative membrane protein
LNPAFNSAFNPVLVYLTYMLAGFALLAVFVLIYTRFTPYREIQLLRQGNRAVAYFLSGSVLGFSLTIASATFSHSSFYGFLAWAAGALAVQVVVYVLLNRVFSDLGEQIKANNAAVGLISGVTALSAGVINAACIYS